MTAAIVQSSVILLIALCAVAVLGRQSAALRHAVLAVGVLSALVGPILAPLLPSWDHPPIVPIGTVGAVYDRAFLVAPQGSGAVIDRAHSRSDVPTLPQRIWIGGLAITAMLLLIRGIHVGWLAFHAKPISDDRWTSTLHDVSRTLDLTRRVRLVQSECRVLGTWGVLRPRIMLSEGSATWAAARLRLLLAHELAHIKRFDWMVQMLAELGRVFYWFNPLFWIVCRRLRSESEYACDDVVMNVGIDAKDYAAHLLDLARALNNSDAVWS